MSDMGLLVSWFVSLRTSVRRAVRPRPGGSPAPWPLSSGTSRRSTVMTRSFGDWCRMPSPASSRPPRWCVGPLLRVELN